MRHALALVVFLVCFAANPARAALTIDVSSDVIAVTTGFNGASITVFGMQEQAGALVVLVEGPPKTMTIRKKEAILGMWVNADSRRFVSMPAFYEMAASHVLDETAPPDILRMHRIGLPNILAPTEADDDRTSAFSTALLRIKQDQGLYGLSVMPVTYISPQLFKAQFDLPAIVASGHYKVTAFLFRDGALIEKAESAFEVIPEGLSAAMRRFAREHGLMYGLIGVVMALAAGWLATVLLKRE